MQPFRVWDSLMTQDLLEHERHMSKSKLWNTSFHIMRDRQHKRKRLVHLSIRHGELWRIVLHTSDVGGNRFSRGTRFTLGMFCLVHIGKTKER